MHNNTATIFSHFWLFDLFVTSLYSLVDEHIRWCFFSPNWGQRFSNISNSFFEFENSSGVDEGVDSASRDYQNTRQEDEQHLQLKDCFNHSYATIYVIG